MFYSVLIELLRFLSCLWLLGINCCVLQMRQGQRSMGFLFLIFGLKNNNNNNKKLKLNIKKSVQNYPFWSS